MRQHLVSTLESPLSPDDSATIPRQAGQDALRVAIIGNPNTGKTTLFNALTGLRQRVGNFAGVTVERVEGGFKAPDGRRVTVDYTQGAA